MGPAIEILTSPPGDSDARLSVRIIDLEFFFFFFNKLISLQVC